ncbi:MAG: hypothetical protein A2176_06150 [Spirochaetes bacterium RBG_13_51_14]|nr:MAG: hypothetical protein A2176_06150 [Spirochaetes bacterium RBG_13_51_14]
MAACVFAGYGYSYSQEPEDGDGIEKEASPVTFCIGFTAYYANWAPVWKIYKFFDPVAYNKRDYTLPRGSFMYGPAVSIRINKWQISGNFLYGEFRAAIFAFEFLRFAPSTSFISPYMVTKKTKKYDSDLLVSYQINKWFKIFFGPKYQGYQNRERNSQKLLTEDIRYHSGGLGAGIGSTMPIVRDLYLLMNFSGIVMIGSQMGTKDDGDRTSIAYGGNEIVTLAYNIRAIHTTISVGGRLQYLYFDTTPNKYYTNKHDIFYGIHISVTASF